ELSEALAKQKALAARIAAQKAQVAKLNALQQQVASDIASTKVALDGITADLVTVQNRVQKTTADVNEARRNMPRSSPRSAASTPTSSTRSAMRRSRQPN